ncbi:MULTISPECIES: short-chain dehydrogenase [unclassified Bacillus (in: firmicutes)]|uniref:short-chain dehydrogenase n=1 Tax=unclassified Bacillus (in: firmicutes) TaxID=185979 RepID=UPI000555D790|nr:MULTISPECIES: short-chain dehydrogenase [unclassified Bacillus (in: firmicutes)]
MHVLVVGGTGMLQKVSKWFTEQELHTSVIGRNIKRLKEMRNSCDTPERVTCLEVDYHNSDELRVKIKNSIQKNGPVTLVVAWIHSTAVDALQIISEEIETFSKEWELFHIIGSSAYKSGEKIRCSSLCRYYRIILGFIVEEKRSRWLTHDEIASGVIAGIQHKQREWIVGTLEPWDARPSW